MEIKFNKQDLIGIIEKYYRQYENREQVKVNIKTEKGGYGFWEGEVCSTVITVSSEMSLLGIKTSIREHLDNKDLKNIFTKLLAEEGYEVLDLSYDEGIHSRWEGYFTSEHEVKTPYFNGITLKVTSREEQNQISGFTKSKQKVLVQKPSSSYVDHSGKAVEFIPH